MAPGRRRPTRRWAFLVNTTVSVALLGLIAAVALVVRPPSPPGIAEFAPQAAKPITKAPPGQSSAQGAGACTEQTTCAGTGPRPTPTAKPLGDVLKSVPSALQCYTWPDGSVTQTFDPQSAPCVASWPDADQGNGGATSQGVTATEIRIAYPRYSSGSNLTRMQAMVNFFNSRYELYGRKLRLVGFDSQQQTELEDSNTLNPSKQHADAVAAAALKPFAALDFVDGGTLGAALPSYLTKLTQSKIIAAVGGEVAPDVSADALHRARPYVWTYTPSTDDVMHATAALICTQLRGKPASYSSTYARVTRSFALFVPKTSSTGGDLAGLPRIKSDLAACGLSSLPIAYYDVNDPSGSKNAQAYTQLRQAGVTSLIYYPWLNYPPQLGADRNGYHPEWVTIGYRSYSTGAALILPNSQTASSFGVAAFDKIFPIGQEVWNRAFVAGGGDSASNWYGGAAVYHELQIIAAGAQLAGPRLTPETFAAALAAAEFPNPGAGAVPSFQAHVGFADSQTMVNDFTTFWFDKKAGTTAVTESSSQEGGHPWSAFCYGERGKRYRADDWPSAPSFYQGACR